MTRQIQLKVALVALLVAAAVIGSGSIGWYSGGTLAFGIFNVLVTPRGTFGVRMATVAATFAMLLWPLGAGVFFWLMAWLVWPPAYVVTWMLRIESDRAAAAASATGAVDSTAASRARLVVVGCIAAVAIASVAYRLILEHRLEQSAALFVGIPSILAIVVVLAVSPRSAVGVACKAVTVGLLVSMIFLGEGVICVLMSAPLFYVVGVAIATAMQRARERAAGPTGLFFSSLIALATVPFSLEGTVAPLTVDRHESVSATRVVPAPADAVGHALFAPPRFDRAVPAYLGIGFPRATALRVERSGDLARWIVRIRGGEWRLDGIEPRIGELALTLEEQRPGFVRWHVVSDSSHTTHYLMWRDSRVEWEPIDARTTRVTWTLDYDRSLDPAWYFGPWERYAARLAAGYLIDAVATP